MVVWWSEVEVWWRGVSIEGLVDDGERKGKCGSGIEAGRKRTEDVSLGAGLACDGKDYSICWAVHPV